MGGLEGSMRHSEAVFADQVSQFVSKLARGWNPNRSWPVGVEVAEFVCQDLVLVGREPVLVVDDVVARRIDGSLG